jgi:hypothetical protein
VEIVAGVLVVAIVVAIAAVLVIREAGRIAKEPPPALFDLEEAHDWVVRRILEFQLEYFEKKGVSGNGSGHRTAGPVVVGGAEAVAYIVDRAAATGEAYLPEQVYGVLETQISYLRSIGAIGPPADDE